MPSNGQIRKHLRVCRFFSTLVQTLVVYRFSYYFIDPYTAFRKVVQASKFGKQCADCFDIYTVPVQSCPLTVYTTNDLSEGSPPCSLSK